jgi:hypothetical protein
MREGARRAPAPRARAAAATPRHDDAMTSPAVPDRVANVRALVRLLDSAVRVPGTSFRVGLDAVLGLVPGVGDVAGAALSSIVVLAAARQGVGLPVLLRMVLNVGVDMLVGAVPLVGDLFDAGWRANTRNLALMDRALAAPVRTRRSSGALVAGVLVTLLAVIGAGLWLAVWVVREIAARI